MNDDLISRQAAIARAVPLNLFGREVMIVSVSELENLPSAQPKRKKGKWYKPTGMMPPEYAGVYRCSECNELAMRDWKTYKQNLTNFCPNCGADMRGELECTKKI